MKKKNKYRKKQTLAHYIAYLLGICFVVRVLSTAYYDLQLNYNGSCTVAEIYKYKGIRRSRVKGYYEFSVNGKWYRGYATSLSDEKLENRIRYDTITIMYLPSNPEINRSKKAVKNDLFVMLINKLTNGLSW